MGQSKAFKLGRDSRTGQFISVEEARKNSGRYFVEHIPKAGHGEDEERSKK